MSCQTEEKKDMRESTEGKHRGKNKVDSSFQSSLKGMCAKCIQCNRIN
jgi:hypothetical protein